MAEDKIPVLTEVYNPKSTPEAVLTDALKKEALDKAAAFVRQEMAGFQAKIMADHQAQINAMLETIAKRAEDNVQAVAKRAEENVTERIGIMHNRVGTLQQEVFARLKTDFDDEKQTLQQTAANEMQTIIAGQVKEGQSALQASIENTLQKSIPEETFAQLRADFSAEKDTLMKSATTEIKAMFSKEMAEGQQSLQANIDATLQKALPDMESKLRTELTAELQQLLLKVRFVLPE